MCSGWDTTNMLSLAKNSLVKIEVQDGKLSWCNSQFICRQSSGRSIRTFSWSRLLKRHGNMQN
jgi:hypothetical protein